MTDFQEIICKLIDKLNEGVIIFKVDDLQDPGKMLIEFVNKTADTIAGGEVSSKVGITLGEAFPDFVKTGIPDKYLEVFKTKKSIDLGSIEYGDEIVKKQIFRLRCSPLNGSRVFVSYSSITQEVAHAKDAFLANMSHELKTLLNGIVGMAQLLIDTEMSMQQSDYANTIHQCSVQLLAIINDILDFSKMEAGRVTLSEEVFELRECLEEVFDIISLKASKKKLQISYLIDDDVPDCVFADKARLKQVLVNLVDNGVKFTDIGEIIAKVKLQQDTESDALIQFEVTDTGIGIAEKHYTEIFEVFTQVHDVVTKKYPGTGLGLPICKYLVNLMRGEIWVESQVNKGSSFFFTLRVAKRKKEPQCNDVNLRGKKVLIVDDNSTNRTILCSLIIKWGMMPIACGSAEEALVFINSDLEFDIGLLDVQMPRTSGITLAEEIRKTLPDLPLVSLSSMGDTYEIRPNLFVANLTKPIKHDRLYHICREFLCPDIKFVAKKDKKREHKNLRILLIEDVIHNQKVAQGLLGKLGYHNIDIVGNGLEAIEYVKRNTYDVVFLDLIMEPIDGFQTAKRLSGIFGDHRPYLVAMTAQTTDSIREKCRQTGMDGFIGKPIVLQELETMLNVIESKQEKKGI